MSLKCQYVKDMYPLYVEGDLSRETKEAVELHLRDCRACKEVYQGERNFQDILKQEEKKGPSPKLDNRVKLQVKYRKLRSIALILGLLLIFSVFNSFSVRRNNMYHHAMQMEHNRDAINLLLYYSRDSWPGIAPHETLVSIHRSAGDNMYRNASWLESRKLAPDSLNLATSQFNAFMEMIEIRRTYDALSPQDEVALEMMRDYFEDLRTGLNMYTSNYRGGIGSRFLARLDLPGLAKVISQINELSLHYVLYNQIPEEALTHEEAAAILTQTLGLTNHQLVIRSQKVFPEGNLAHEYDLFQGESKVGIVRADAYSGQLISIYGSKTHGEQGELMPLEEIQNELKAFLSTSIYNYEMEYLGINHNHTFYPPGPKLYSFLVTPFVDGYEIMNSSLAFTFDARTGFIDSATAFWRYNDLPLGLVLEERVAADQALEGYDSEGYIFLQTVVLRSVLSGEHELVHSFRHESYGYLYINARTGKEDLPMGVTRGWWNILQRYR